MGNLRCIPWIYKLLEKVTDNKVTKSIKGIIKTTQSIKEVRIKDMGRKNMNRLKIKGKMIELNLTELTP